ncbi:MULTISPECIES: flagellar protein FlaG [unclassified Pseudomonas]|uniref:flagellar protein FlaG n=1 Tax=unclassified Pseudomonas TaxID=196821 RepID=UPI00244707C0|nr:MULTISPECIES: flagellar protein FlaG [unclassified Pseudomonas]MDG9924784.1 flagellar protein FlaG [Pseudomonas sp. GD04045]MDH0036765.1 flagellar protein FlaG [Pseudomonas sp. GD04019]
MDVGSIKNSLNPLLTGRAAPVEERKQSTGSPEEEPVVQAAAAGQGGASREQVESAVSTIQEFVQSVRRNVNFTLEDASGRVVVKVTDASSGDIIRQIPSEEALQLAESLEEVRSLLFKAEA